MRHKHRQLPTVPVAPDDTAVVPELTTQGNPAAAASTEVKPGGEATTKTLQGKEDPTLAETNYPILWWTPPPTLQEKQEQGTEIELPYTVDTCGLEYKCTFTTDRSVLSTTNVVLFRGSQLDEQDLLPAATRPASQARVLNNVLKDAEEAKKREAITSILDPTHVWSHSFPPTTAATDFVETVFQSRPPNNPILRQQSFVDIATMPPRVDLQEKNRLRTLGKENGGRAAVVWITTGDSEGGGCVDAPSGRENFVKELVMVMDVDIYGPCLNNSAWPVHPDTQKLLTAQEIMQDYKFVFALERVNCQDYITQHLADALTVGAVPIADGPQDYSRFSPSENAFVEIRNFLAPEQFAQEIDRLDRNDTLYLERLSYRVNKDAGSGEGVEVMAEGTGTLSPLFRQTFGGGAISESAMAAVTPPTLKTWTPDHHGVYCGICELAHKLSRDTYDWTTHTQQRKEIASNNTPSAPICETSPRYLPGLPAQMQAYDAYLQAQNELAFIRQQEEMEALLRQEQLEDAGSVMSPATAHVVNVTVSFNSNNNTGYNVSNHDSLENNTIGQPSVIVLHQDVSSSKAQQLAELDPATAYHHIPATSISSTDGTTLPLSEVHYLLLLILAMFVGVGTLVLILSKSARQKLFWPWRHLFYKRLPRDEGGVDALTLERVMLRELGEDLLYD
ncbi:Alpha-(1,3)-fucosyltransferase 11 [Mortierella sp. GBA39]|nr:Alpha-(1,3)-fucosyltransferase 11 [Mortierella sp. GBA39]